MIDWVSQLGVEITSKSAIVKRVRGRDDYYVYVLWKMYKTSPIPFYVGKGHFYRIIKHEMDSEANSNKHKINIIKKHEKLGIELGYSVKNFYKDEEEAFQVEIELISLIGREDLKEGPLANKTDGGDGSRGHLALKGGDSLSAKPVFADNVRYTCLKEAGEALGVDPGTVAARIKVGRKGYYYEGEGQRKQSKNIIGRYRKRVIVEGKEFISLSEADKKSGIDFRIISKRIKYGWKGYYYLDQGQLPRRTIWGDRKDKVGVIIKGKEYSTLAEASRKTGETYAMIRKRCLSSNYSDYKRLDGIEHLKTRKPKYSKPVFVKGVRYESLSEAAKYLNVSKETVNNNCKNLNKKDWQFINEINKKDCYTPKFTSKPIKVSINGIKFNSLSEAARNNDVDINTIKNWCRSSSFPNCICDQIKKKKTKDGRPGLIQLEINGVRYRSINEASKKLGIARKVIKQKIELAEEKKYKLV